MNTATVETTPVVAPVAYLIQFNRKATAALLKAAKIRNSRNFGSTPLAGLDLDLSEMFEDALNGHCQSGLNFSVKHITVMPEPGLPAGRSAKVQAARRILSCEVHFGAASDQALHTQAEQMGKDVPDYLRCKVQLRQDHSTVSDGAWRVGCRVAAVHPLLLKKDN